MKRGARIYRGYRLRRWTARLYEAGGTGWWGDPIGRERSGEDHVLYLSRADLMAVIDATIDGGAPNLTRSVLVYRPRTRKREWGGTRGPLEVWQTFYTPEERRRFRNARRRWKREREAAAR